MSAPDSCVPVLGYRIWGVTRDGLLESPTAAFAAARRPVWDPFERAEAECTSARPCGRSAPNPSHMCGIHAFTALGPALRWARAIARARPVVLGAVHLWGRVVQTRTGYRARFAYPASLLSVHGRGRAANLDALRETYGLRPVVSVVPD